MSNVIMIGCDLHDRSMLIRYAVGDAEPQQRSFRNDVDGRSKMIEVLWDFAKKTDRDFNPHQGLNLPGRPPFDKVSLFFIQFAG